MDRIQIGLRVTEDMQRKLDNYAASWDVSKNAAINVLLNIGIQAYENATVQPEPERHRVPPRTQE